FYAWGKRVCDCIHSNGHWSDMTDPASGYPMFTPRGTSLYPDVDGAVRLLRYSTTLVGCCKVLSHPRWGSRNYPATLFTTAPLSLVEEALEKACLGESGVVKGVVADVE
ncbi:hypothetical protein HDU76_008718, partial [Blyttiomyces sp. JEL0837]